MAVEELDMTIGSNPVSVVKDGKEEKEEEQLVNKMNESIGTISPAAPGETNEEFLNRVLSTSPDQLIPLEDCHLQSRGIYYGWSDGIVKVRAMGTTAEKVLTTQRLTQSGQAIDYLFRECCRFPDGFDPAELLLGDRIFLLYFLRGITHGNIYEFAVSCPNPNCEATNTHMYDLNNLASTITYAKPELGQEPFKVVLPYLSRVTKRDFWVGVRFLRASDSNDMMAKRKSHKKMMAAPGSSIRTGTKAKGISQRGQARQNEALDDTISQNMEKIIVSVLGVTDHFQIRRLIEQLHAQDSAAIREWLRENTPSMDNTVTVTCADCSQQFTVELPISESFFRPSKS